uniref:Bm416 n=1 Tax=Brugia malayi TaxID=6279 RepID=A0A1I9GCV7_BRUMA|nr:Bm416 [Brugia malayi]
MLNINSKTGSTITTHFIIWSCRVKLPPNQNSRMTFTKEYGRKLNTFKIFTKQMQRRRTIVERQRSTV